MENEVRPVRWWRSRQNYTDHYLVTAEGNRFGLMTCRRCGAAVILDDDAAPQLHDNWHEEQANRKPHII